MKRTNIYLTIPQEEAIVKIIQYNGGGTKAEIVRNALNDYIKKYSKNISKIN